VATEAAVSKRLFWDRWEIKLKGHRVYAAPEVPPTPD